MERKREKKEGKEERKKGVKGRRERGKENEGKSTAVVLDHAVLLRHSQQTEPRHLVELHKEDIICFGSGSLSPSMCWAWTALYVCVF